jgi:hypothetical protein
VRRSQTPATRATRVRLRDFERKIHSLSVSGEDEGPSPRGSTKNGPHRKRGRQSKVKKKAPEKATPGGAFATSGNQFSGVRRESQT